MSTALRAFLLLTVTMTDIATMIAGYALAVLLQQDKEHY